MKRYILCITFACAFGLPVDDPDGNHPVPSFEWLEDVPANGSGSLYYLSITYPDGDQDVAVLEHNDPLENATKIDDDEDDDNQCTLQGYLQKESNVSISVNGCPGSNNLEIMFESEELEDDMFQVVDGKVTAFIPTDLQGPADDAFSIPEDNFPEDNFSDVEDRDRFSLPAKMTMRLAMFYDDTFRNWHKGSSVTELKKHLNLVQNFFHLKRLGTKIDLKVVTYGHLKGQFAVTGSGLKGVSTLSRTFQNDVDANLYITKFVNGHYNGLAWREGLCYSDKYYRSGAVGYKGHLISSTTTAHELGHLGGMKHDFTRKKIYGNKYRNVVRYDSSYRSCTSQKGLMNYGSNRITWSTCSSADFLRYFQKRVFYYGEFCLK